MHRLKSLQGHITPKSSLEEPKLSRNLCHSTDILPGLNQSNMEQFMDPLYTFKRTVYDTFASHRELLPASVEGLTKGTLTVVHTLPHRVLATLLT